MDPKTEKLKQLIESKYSSIREFSIAAGIPYTTVHSILKRGVDNSSVDNVIRMCNILGITVDSLYNEDKDDNPNLIAAHATEDLTEEEIADLLDYIEFLKGKRK